MGKLFTALGYIDLEIHWESFRDGCLEEQHSWEHVSFMIHNLQLKSYLFPPFNFIYLYVRELKSYFSCLGKTECIWKPNQKDGSSLNLLCWVKHKQSKCKNEEAW